MKQKEAEKNHDDTTAHQQQTALGKVVEGTSRADQQQPKQGEDNRSSDVTGRHRKFPFIVSIQTDWFAVSVSLLTLLGLGVTVYYSHRQAIAAHESVIAANKALDLTRKALADSEQGSKDASNQFQVQLQHYDAGLGKTGELAQASKDQLEAFKENNRNTAQTQILISLPMLQWTGNHLGSGPEFNGVRSLRDAQFFKNVGDTRAIGPVVRLGWGAKKPDRDTPYQWHSNELNHDILARNEERYFAHEFTRQEEQQVRQLFSENSLFLYGEIRYDDVFPTDIGGAHRRRDHLYAFCLKIIDIDWNKPDWTGQMIPYGFCYDEKCPNY